MNIVITKDSVSMALGAKGKDATTVEGWTTGQGSVPKEAARVKALKEAARERAAEREAVRAVAAQSMGVLYVEGPIINPIVPTTQI